MVKSLSTSQQKKNNVNMQITHIHITKARLLLAVDLSKTT